MKTAFIISGILGFFVWPVFMIAGVMLGDDPTVPLGTDILRLVAIYSALLPPLVWIVSLIVAIKEAKKDNRRVIIRRCAIAPYAAAGVHFLALVTLFTLGK